MSLRRFVRNSGWLIADRIVRLGGGLVLTVWLARTVGPEDFGAFGYAAAVAAIVTALSSLGLQGLVMRDSVRGGDKGTPALLATVLLLRLAAAALSVLLTAAILYWARDTFDEVARLALLLALVCVPQVFDTVEWSLLAKEQARMVTTAKLQVFAVSALLRAGLLLTGAGVLPFVLALGAETIATVAVVALQARREGVRWPLRGVDTALLGRYTRAALPLVATTACVQMYMRADQILIAQLLDTHQAGLYAAAVRIAEAWNFIPTAALLAIAPRLTMAHQQSNEAFEALLRRTLGGLMYLSFGFATVVSLLAQPLITLLYGPAFAPAAEVLRVQAFSSVFVAIGVASGPYLLNHHLLGVALVQTAFGAAMNIALNVALIPRLGIMGAAYATLASYALSTVMMNAVLPSTRRLFRLQLQALKGPR